MSSHHSDLAARVKAAARCELPNMVEAAGYRPTRNAKTYHCRFHVDKTASAHLYTDNIHSFCCGRSLDPIDLEQLLGGGTTADAIRRLAHRHRIEAGHVSVSIQPRFDAETLAAAELFRIGLVWYTERELEAAKLPLVEQGEVDGERILP